MSPIPFLMCPVIMPEMSAEDLAPLPGEDTLRLMRVATYTFVLLLPLSVLLELGSTSTQGALYLHTRRGFYLSDLPLAAILVLALTTNFKWRRGPLFLTLPLLLLIVLAFLSFPGALSPSFALYTALRWLVAFSVYLWFLQPLVPAKSLLSVFVAIATLYGLLFLAGSLLGAPVGAPMSMSIATVAAAVQRILPGPELLAGFLAVAFLLNVSLLIYWPAVAAWWMLGIGLLATMSGAAWLALLAVLVPLLLWHYRRRRRWRPQIVIVISGLMVTLFVAAFGLRGTGAFSPALSGDIWGQQLSLGEWAELNGVAWSIIGQRPFLGGGAGNFPHAMARVDTMVTVQNVRNVPLLLSAEVGIAGGLLWLFLWLAGTAAMLWRLKTRSAWLLAAMSAWFILGFLALFHAFPWAANGGRLLTATTLGLVGRGLSRRR